MTKPDQRSGSVAMFDISIFEGVLELTHKSAAAYQTTFPPPPVIGIGVPVVVVTITAQQQWIPVVCTFLQNGERDRLLFFRRRI